MSVQAPAAPSESRRTSRVFVWLIGIVCFGFLGYSLFSIAHQIIVPPPAPRLTLIQDIPLPSGLGNGGNTPLAPGVQEDFDHFDFQAYDVATHHLFIAHTGPNPDLLAQAGTKFDPRFDGHIVVFDTQQDKVIARVPVPQVSGVVDASDLGKIFVSDSQDNVIDDINVHTLQVTKSIKLPDNSSPDAITYDPDDQRIFVSEPAAPPSPTGNQNPDRHLMNIAVIDAANDTLLTQVNFGLLRLFGSEKVPKGATDPSGIPAFGHDVGHSDYDHTLGHVYAVSQILPDANNTNPNLLPPPSTAEFVSINPVTMAIDQRIILPTYCSTPHGMAIDANQHVAFIACTDFGSGLFENLVRVDLRTMKVIPADPSTMRLASIPDLVRIDHSLHLLFVACSGGVTIFDESAGNFKRLGIYIIGKATHTIAINEQTQEMYFPIFAGGRPVLRIERYNPNGS